MKFYAIGDVHGKIDEYLYKLDSLPNDAITIQVGDMGVGFEGVKLPKMPKRHLWFRGNHDWPEKCRAHPNYLGDWGYRPDWELFWLAGAWSIDWQRRIPGHSWWADEQLSHEQLEEAINLYKWAEPKIVLSHECPASIGEELLKGMAGEYFAAKLECSLSHTAKALDRMFRIHQPEYWVFGHYHINKTLQVGPTKFTCLAELSSKEFFVETGRLVPRAAKVGG